MQASPTHLSPSRENPSTSIHLLCIPLASRSPYTPHSVTTAGPPSLISEFRTESTSAPWDCSSASEKKHGQIAAFRVTRRSSDDTVPRKLQASLNKDFLTVQLVCRGWSKKIFNLHSMRLLPGCLFARCEPRAKKPHQNAKAQARSSTIPHGRSPGRNVRTRHRIRSLALISERAPAIPMSNSARRNQIPSG